MAKKIHKLHISFCGSKIQGCGTFAVNGPITVKLQNTKHFGTVLSGQSLDRVLTNQGTGGGGPYGGFLVPMAGVDTKHMAQENGRPSIPNLTLILSYLTVIVVHMQLYTLYLSMFHNMGIFSMLSSPIYLFIF